MLGSVIQLRPLGLPKKPQNAAVATAATPKKTALATAAVSEFLAEMAEFAGGGELQWKRVAASYDAMCPERCWPALQDQTLSNLLVAMVCTRRRVRTPKGRLTFVGFPLEFGEPIALAS